jgi:predicted O-methyltransferase YrrM
MDWVNNMRWDSIAGLMKERDLKVLVEIGTGRGTNLLNVLKLMGDREITIFSIDPYVEYPEKSHGTKQAVARNLKSVRGLFKKPNVTHIRETSMVAVQDFDDSSVDIVFIDGCHEYEAVYSDIVNWHPKIRPGGVLCGHDYRPPKVGPARRVAKAVDQYIAETGMELTQHGDAVWILEYPEGEKCEG